MDVIYGLIPGMLLVGLLMVGVLFWAARSGQFDDLEGDAQRILMDDDREPPRPERPVADAEPDRGSAVGQEREPDGPGT